MSDDAQHFESIAPQEGDKIVDRPERAFEHKKMMSDAKIVGSKDMRKEGVEIVTRRGTKRS
jgi:hypothetical protein